MFAKYDTLPPSTKNALPFLLLILAVLAAYGNVYQNPFVLDDLALMVGNQFLTSWHFIGKILTTNTGAGSGNGSTFYRPLTLLLYWPIYQIGGLSLFGFHALNVALHAANACLVYRLGKKLNFNSIAVFLASLLWAMHPIHTEAITYMSGTADPLYSFFSLLGACVLLPDFTRRKIWLAGFCFLLALLSKESAISFPLLAAACLFAVSPDRLNAKTYLKLWPLFVVAAFYMLGRTMILSIDVNSVAVIKDVYTQNMMCRIYTFLATLPTYAALLIWPHDLYMDHAVLAYVDPFELPVLIGTAMVGAAIAQIIWGRGRRGIALSWAFLWFAAADCLYTGILIPLNFLFCEHWMYLPSVGLFLGIGETLAQAGQRLHLASYKQSAVILTLIAACTAATKTYDQNHIWSDPEILYNNVLAHNPDSRVGLENLSAIYIRRKDYNEGIDMIRHAIALGVQSPVLHSNLAIALMNSWEAPQHIEEIKSEFAHALFIDPDYYLAYFGLSQLYANLLDRNQAAFFRNKGNEVRERLGLPPE